MKGNLYTVWEILRFGVGWMGGGVCEGDRRGRGEEDVVGIFEGKLGRMSR